jgi:predicted nucleotidyltransferase
MGIQPSSRRAAPQAPISIADALFNKVQQRVLGVLFGNAERSFFASEIIRLAESGSGAVQRELARLEGAGLVTAKRIGRQKHYRANVKAPVFRELRALVLKTSGVADMIRAALASRATDIRAAFVYGSVAKGRDTATSDVDVLVISDRLAYSEVYELLEKAAVTAGRNVNPTIYSTDEFAARVARRNSFLTRVLSQPKIWVIGEADDLRS